MELWQEVRRRLGECYITQDSGNSIPLVSDELLITKYDPLRKDRQDGRVVQKQGRNGKYYLGTEKYNGDLELLEFVPIDKEAYKKENSCFTVDYWKSVGNGIVGGISKYSTEAKNSLDYIGENWLGLDYDKPCVDNPNFTMRDNINKANEFDAKEYNELRENSPYKRTFDDTSKNTKFTLNAIDTALAIHGVQQISSACVDYARLNKSYINAKTGVVKENTALLRQAVNNVNKKPQGLTLGANGGNASNYISDVNKELKKLKNIEPTGTKIVSKAKIDNVSDIDDIIDASKKGTKGVSNPSNEVFTTEKIEWTATRPKGTQQTYEIYQRNDIDWDMVRTSGDKRFIGKTNADAAAKGLAPQLKDGSFATLHHIGQDSRGPIAEASTRYHGVGKYGQDILHSQYGRSTPNPYYPIDRKKFGVDTREYWKWCANNR